MAVLHHATLTPTKIEILRSLVGSRPWGRDLDPAAVTMLGAYRFDDPAGEVGLETFLLTGAGDAVLQVALTYRDAPLPGAEDALVSVADHSVLGSRWVYDGAADGAYARALLATMVDGGHQAEMAFATDSGLVPHDLTTFVQGRGGSLDVPVGEPPEAALLRSGPTTLVLLRHPGSASAPAGAPTLWGTWPGRDEVTLLAWAGAA